MAPLVEACLLVGVSLVEDVLVAAVVLATYAPAAARVAVHTHLKALTIRLRALVPSAATARQLHLLPNHRRLHLWLLHRLHIHNLRHHLFILDNLSLCLHRIFVDKVVRNALMHFCNLYRLHHLLLGRNLWKAKRGHVGSLMLHIVIKVAFDYVQLLEVGLVEVVLLSHLGVVVAQVDQRALRLEFSGRTAVPNHIRHRWLVLFFQ